MLLRMRAGTHREAPVDVRHLGVQVEAEDEEENPRHHAGAAADKLKEVDASAWRAHHDGLYADESNEGQHLGVGGGQRQFGCWLVSKETRTRRHFKGGDFKDSSPSGDVRLCFL